MKIIADSTPINTFTETFLVEMTADEIARVAGYKYKSECPGIKIGRELAVSKLFDLIVQLRNSPEQVKTTINILSAMVDLLGSQLPNFINLLQLQTPQIQTQAPEQVDGDTVL